jgi:hypothetical protein
MRNLIRVVLLLSHHQVNENGTVQMMIKNVEDTINIRQLTPYLGILTTLLLWEKTVETTYY